MVSSCSVRSCRSNCKNGPKVSRFNFPEDEVLKQLWVTAIGRPNFVCSKYSKVCELHFCPEDIERTTSVYDEKKKELITISLHRPRLVNGAVPSLLPEKEKEKEESVPLCCLCCIFLSDIENVTMHPFPDETSKINEKWKTFIQCPPETSTENLWLCSQHFLPSDFKTRSVKLKKNAVPSLYPDTSKELFVVVNEEEAEQGEQNMEYGEDDLKQEIEIVLVESQVQWHEDDGSTQHTLDCDAENAVPSSTNTKADYSVSSVRPLQYKGQVKKSRSKYEIKLLEIMKTAMCRVCGTKEQILYPIFTDKIVKNSSTLLGKIEKYLPLKILSDDGLPPNICQQCENLVDKWHELYESCLQADAVIREMFDLKNSKVFPCYQRITEDKRPGKENIPAGNPLPQSQSLEVGKKTSVTARSHMSCPSMQNGLAKSEKNTGTAGEENDWQVCQENKSCEYQKEEESKSTPPLEFIHCAVFKCKYCSETFSLKREHEQHQQVCASETAVCDVCGKTVSKRFKLKQHLKQHSLLPLSHICETCGEIFFTKYKLNCHIKYLHNRTPRRRVLRDYKQFCEPCCKIFASISSYRYHQYLHRKGLKKCLNFKIVTVQEDGRDVTYICPVCSKSFYDKRTLIIHVNTRIKKRKCSICKQWILSEKHMLTHKCPEENGFYCSYCRKQYRSRSYLDVHERIHTGVKPFKCNICNASFIAFLDMTRHRIRHGPPPFKCEECGKQFREKVNYQGHLEAHAGVKYQCTYCDKLFTGKKNLRIHCRRKHQVKLILTS